MQEESASFRAQISVCSWRGIDVPTIEAINHTRQSENPKIGCMFGTGDALISRTRSTQATKFLHNPEMGDVLLFIDTDIVFEPNQAIELVKLCHQGFPVIGGLYVTRNVNQPLATVRLKPNTRIDFTGAMEPLEVTFASTGFFAIHRKVLAAMAKTMPLCHPGDQIEMYPFFMPMTYDKEGAWEYLSEDWAFCERARNLGFETFVAPSVRVGHFGERIYWVNDLFQKTSDTTYAVVTEGRANKSEMINDLGRFRKADPRAIAESYANHDAMQELTAEWLSKSPETAEQVAGFWALSEKALDAFAMHAISSAFPERLRSAINFATPFEGPILDIGGFLGEFSVAMDKGNEKLIYVEQDSPLRNFAISRLMSRHKTIPAPMDLDQFQSAGGKPAFAEAAIALYSLNFCHPMTAKRLIGQVFDRLLPGGKIFVVSCQQEGWPFCPTSEEQIAAMMSDAGFAGGGGTWQKPNNS